MMDDDECVDDDGCMDDDECMDAWMTLQWNGYILNHSGFYGPRTAHSMQHVSNVFKKIAPTIIFIIFYQALFSSHVKLCTIITYMVCTSCLTSCQVTSDVGS